MNKTLLIQKSTEYLNEIMEEQDFIYSAIYTLYLEAIENGGNSKTAIHKVFVKYCNDELGRAYLINDCIYGELKCFLSSYKETKVENDVLKVKDIFRLPLFVDVYENIADEIGIAFVNEGGDPLTDEGKKHFAVALEFPIARLDKDILVIDSEKYFNDKQIYIDGYSFEGDDLPPQLQNVKDLFWYYAGYCSTEDYKKYFKGEL